MFEFLESAHTLNIKGLLTAGTEDEPVKEDSRQNIQMRWRRMEIQAERRNIMNIT